MPTLCAPVHCLNPSCRKRVRSRRARMPQPLCQDCDCRTVRIALGIPVLLCVAAGCTASQTRGRGLCDGCWHDPEIRRLHSPIEAPQANRDATPDDDDYADRPLPRWPTDAAPGSAEKRGILAARAQARPGVQLHHPHDERINPDGRAINRARKLFASHIETP